MYWNICVLTVVLACARAEYKYDTKYFKVPLDHFGYQRAETFQIKYLVNEDNWDREKGPIFFYTGNEGQIELFAKHTGFMWEIAKEFSAKIVFAEHRYYGTSMPFGNKSLDKEHIGYLTSAQALADYADLIDFLQDHSVKPKYPVIAFGGSYGGMLAAYFRMKYPHMVEGSIAASAPIHMFPGMMPCDAFYRIVTSTFKVASENCANNIRRSWGVIRNFTTTANHTEWLKSKWNLCDPVKNSSDVQGLVNFLQSMYVTLAMVDYPFDCDFLVPLPSYPVRTVCQYLDDKSINDTKLLENLGKVLDTFTNYKKQSKCVDYKKGDDYGNLDASGWDYQACTEMVMPMCTNGVTDMFEAQPWDFKKFSDECRAKFSVGALRDAARVQYGGNQLYAASNIVFSNGLLDPWTAGGYLTGSDRVKSVMVIGGAHHLDLMPSNPADPPTVVATRDFHKQNIRRWIREFRSRQ